jgi:hypothetical protein
MSQEGQSHMSTQKNTRAPGENILLCPNCGCPLQGRESDRSQLQQLVDLPTPTSQGPQRLYRPEQPPHEDPFLRAYFSEFKGLRRGAVRADAEECEV